MLKKLKQLFFALIIMAFSYSASATIITFDSYSPTDTWLSIITSDGFTFVSDNLQITTGNTVWAENGTYYLRDWQSSSTTSTITMSSDDRTTFDLNSFDFYSGSLTSGGNNAISLMVTGYNSLNEIIAQMMFNFLIDYSNYTFTTLYLDDTFTDLYYVEFQVTGWQINSGFDNIVVNETTSASTTADIPEPSSLAIFGMGLLGFAGFRPRKQK